MSIRFEHSIDVTCAPERAFAVLDDVSLTPRWLSRCTGIEKLTPGPNAVGTKLKYDYRDAGRTGTMEGEITERTPNERLAMRYGDKMMDVTVDFRMARAEGGVRLTHAIEITPRTLLSRVFSPLIRRQLPKQTITAMESLRTLLQSPRA